ncbi:MAG: regulatory protein TetR [Polaromonas sp.]|nr:regulatory protein TetR [Polaromonas sp.]
MNLAESLPNDNFVYSSARMFERRRRILDETRKLIAELGYDGFSIRDVCKRAEVAPHTIYKAFGSKEALVALAIRHYYQSFAETQHYQHSTSTLQGVLERLIINNIHMRGMRQYVSALVGIYFSQTADSELRVATMHTALTSLDHWAVALREGGHIRRGITNEGFIRGIVSALFCVVLDWCRGDISDDDFIFRKMEVLLIYATGATRGEAQKQIGSSLTDILGPRRLFQMLAEEVEKSRSLILPSENVASL